jgi:hypothetical protein
MKAPIQVVLATALRDRGWNRLENVQENQYGEMCEWTHPDIDRDPMPLIDAYWCQETLDNNSADELLCETLEDIVRKANE